MADIDARISTIQQAITELLGRVNKGEVLTKDEALALLQCRKGFDELKQVDTYKEVVRGTKLKEVTDKWVVDCAPVKPQLPDCYNSRVFFEPKDGTRKYLKVFGQGGNGAPMLEYTEDVNDAKLFRSHVGWAGPGPDFDCYHVAMNFLRTFFTMDGQYRPVKAGEAIALEADYTDFVTESLTGQPRLSYVLIKVEG